jgi:hypothetical protein
MHKSTRLLWLLAGTALAGHTQWLSYRDPKTPRTTEGKPNLSAHTPKLNGQPDLSGVWEAQRTPSSEYARVLGPGFEKIQVDSQDATKEAINVFWGLRPEEEPLRPEVATIVKQRARQLSPVAQCLPPGVPMSTFVYPFKLVQAPQEIVMVAGTGDPPRQIYNRRPQVAQRSRPVLDGVLGRQVGRRRARGANHRIQRKNLP